MNFETTETMDALHELVRVLSSTVEMLGVGLAPDWLLDMQHATRASIVHDRVMAELARQFEYHPVISVYNSRGLSYVTIHGNRFRVHCTKDHAGRISINRTTQTRNWNSGQPVIPGLPDPNEHYHIVYLPDDTWTTVSRLLVGVYNGTHPVEVREIDLLASAAVPMKAQAAHWVDESIPTLKIKDRGVQQPLESNDNEETA
jgi:hypothetical protein